jgi:hypothetical protein
MVISSNVGIDPPRPLTRAYSFTLEVKGNARATVSRIDQDHGATGDDARLLRIGRRLLDSVLAKPGQMASRDHRRIAAEREPVLP